MRCLLIKLDRNKVGLFYTRPATWPKIICHVNYNMLLEDIPKNLLPAPISHRFHGWWASRLGRWGEVTTLHLYYQYYNHRTTMQKLTDSIKVWFKKLCK